MYPSPHFLELGQRKTKRKRWVERSPKMKNLHRCHCLQKISKYEKATKTYRLGSNRTPLSIQRVKVFEEVLRQRLPPITYDPSSSGVLECLLQLSRVKHLMSCQIKDFRVLSFRLLTSAYRTIFFQLFIIVSCSKMSLK